MANAAPVLDVVGAGTAFLKAFTDTINELAAGMTVDYEGSATPVTQLWALPDRASVSPGGTLVDDGEQLTVLFSSLNRGMPGIPQGEGYVPPAHTMQFVTYELNLLRLVNGLDNSGNPPTPQTLAADFARITLDAELVWATLVQIHAQNLVVPANEQFAYGPLITLGPEGRTAGVRVPVSWVWTKALGAWTG